LRLLRTPDTRRPLVLVRSELVYVPSASNLQHIKHWCGDPSRKTHVMEAVLYRAEDVTNRVELLDAGGRKIQH
jgi:hypothetical protein